MLVPDRKALKTPRGSYVRDTNAVASGSKGRNTNAVAGGSKDLDTAAVEVGSDAANSKASGKMRVVDVYNENDAGNGDSVLIKVNRGNSGEQALVPYGGGAKEGGGGGSNTDGAGNAMSRYTLVKFAQVLKETVSRSLADGRQIHFDQEGYCPRREGETIEGTLIGAIEEVSDILWFVWERIRSIEYVKKKLSV